MAKRAATILAEHFSTDIETIKDHEYQPGQNSRPVFSLGDQYYSAGKNAPRIGKWKQIQSSYDKRDIIWVMENE